MLRSARSEPEKSLLPLLVMTFTTPPVNEPYSAEMPDVRTCVSRIESSMNRLLVDPKIGSWTLTPLIMKLLSYAMPPLIDS